MELAKIESKYPFRQLVGSLLFLSTVTRPDIAYAVGIVSRFLEKPGEDHVKAGKRILRYLKGTEKFGILYSVKRREEDFVGFSDADYVGDILTRRSTTGYCFFLCGGIVSWGSEKQRSVALSTTEAVYMAACLAVKELLWLKKCFEEIQLLRKGKILLKMDNQSAMKLIKNPEFQ